MCILRRVCLLSGAYIVVFPKSDTNVSFVDDYKLFLLNKQLQKIQMIDLKDVMNE